MLDVEESPVSSSLIGFVSKSVKKFWKTGSEPTNFANLLTALMYSTCFLR